MSAGSVLKVLLRKEFKQIFRNKTILAISLAAPIMQFLILPLAANFEIKNINLVVIDQDHSDVSRELIDKLSSSGYFRLCYYGNSYKQAYSILESDNADVMLEIPADFEKDITREFTGRLMVSANAINGTKAVIGGAYLNNIIAQYTGVLQKRSGTALIMPVEIRTSNWFNPVLNYKIALIPGILAILVTMIGGFLCALNIVKEKEIGTIEQINVSPINKGNFILAKLIPFWILAMVVFSIGICLSYFIYGIVPQGNLFVLYTFIAVYLLAALGFGLLVSTFCNSQREAMFLMFFFMMIFILMGGLFTSLDSMPGWAKVIADANPLKYMIAVMRLVILKGSGFGDIVNEFVSVGIMAIVLNVLAVLNYKKRG